MTKSQLREMGIIEAYVGLDTALAKRKGDNLLRSATTAKQADAIWQKLRELKLK